MPRRKQEDVLEHQDAQTEQAETLTPQRIREPKKVIQLIIDAGRSSIKCQAFVDGATGTPILKVPSVVCCTTTTAFGELGSFAMSRSKSEDGKDITEYWVVGSAAQLQGKEFISMTDNEDHKVTYFPILCLGAIASLPNLYELSTGASSKRRTLHINLSTLSLADPLQLRQAVEQCKWLMVDGIRYRLSFCKNGFLHYPEGYGSSLWTKSVLGDGDKHFLTFDIGHGTATLSEYSNHGKLPKRVMCSPNGGGGIATLIREFSRIISQTDSSKIIRPSQLQEIVETSSFEDGKVVAIGPDGKNIGDSLEAAIHSWVKDSPLTYGLDDLGIKARRNKVTLCGGGFSISPVQQIVKERLLKSGIPPENLLIPPEPGIVALSEMKRLYVGENQNVEQAA
ncbi:hypothetical protein AMR41_26215 [Hapalosiphon sp. MRB220]|nr:hypothetical protein AMR41_26215 [Hapalosiphon sp. MRB220]